MVKTKSPLGSLDARGSLANLLTFSKTGRRNYIRARRTPRDPKSRAQMGRRAMFRFLTSQWKLLYPATQAGWAPYGAIHALSNYNAYMRYALRNWYHYLAPSMYYPALRTGTLGTIQVGPTALEQTNRYRFQFQLNPLSFAWGLIIFARPQSGFNTHPDNAILVQRTRVTSLITWYWTPPDFGSWHFNARQFSIYGLLGAELGEFVSP